MDIMEVGQEEEANEQDVFSLAMEHVIKYLTLNDLLRIRRVNHGLNNLFLSNPLIQSKSFTATLNGRNNFKTETDVQALLDCQVPISGIVFINLPLHEFFLEDKSHFTSFIKKHYKSLKSINFHKCTLSMGRFIEFIAYFKKLEEIVIFDSPTILQTDMGICKYEELIPYFIKVLGKIKQFKLIGNKITEENQSSLLEYMKNLHRLRLGSRRVPFSSEALSPSLLQNANTLSTLHFAGSFTLDDEFISNELSKLRLESLELFGSTFKSDGAIFSSTFLPSQSESLTNLGFNRMHLEKITFTEELKLKKLTLLDCGFGEGAVDFFGSIANLNTTLESIMIGFKSRDLSLNFLSTYLMEIFNDSSRPFKTLSSITIRNLYHQGVGAFLVILKVSMLKSLEISGCKQLGGRNVKEIFNIGTLEYLTLNDCCLITRNFVIHGIGTKTLADLQKLKTLDLSHNEELEDDPILEHIALLPNLECLCLDKTNMSKDGMLTFIDKISNSQQSGIPTKLKSISANYCPNCTFVTQEFHGVARKLYPIKFNAQIKFNLALEDLLKHHLRSNK